MLVRTVLKEACLKCLKKHYSLINNLPFINKKRGRVIIDNDGAVLIGCKIISDGSNNNLKLKKGSVFKNCEFVFYGNDNTIEFGEECKAIDGNFYTEGFNNRIIIKNRNHFAGRIHIACTENTSIIIGDDCLFSSEIVIRSGDSHSILDKSGKRINHAKNVLISDRVWVGYRCLINKGSFIQHDSVLGTGSVVSGSINESNVVIAGIPARVIRKEITWMTDKI